MDLLSGYVLIKILEKKTIPKQLLFAFGRNEEFTQKPFAKYFLYKNNSTNFKLSRLQK